MDQLKTFLIFSAIVGSFIFVKNIRVSVTGAEAVIESPEDSDIEMDSGNQESADSIEDSRPNTTKALVPLDKTNTKMSIQDQLIEAIRSADLCKVTELMRDNPISEKDQLLALGKSFSGPRFQELSVFADFDLKNFDSYQSLEAKTLILMKANAAFNSPNVQLKNDFSQGLTDADLDYIDKVAQLEQKDPGNLFLEQLRNNVYFQYKNVDESQRQQVFEQLMATTHYANPVLDWVRDLYNQSKANVAQFYLAQKVFQTPISATHYFIARPLWQVYDEALREHMISLLSEVLETPDSVQAFGYEGGVYKTFRNSHVYEVYREMPDESEYDKTKNQPTYSLSELKIDWGESCDPVQVNELAIKLRAL
jgi:hypothetical protein